MRVIALSLAGGVLAAGLLTAGGTASAATHHSGASRTPAVLSCSEKREIKPAKFEMSCADGNSWWKKVSWSSWGGATASGKGDLYQNDCTPDCAGGTFKTYASTLTLSSIKKTSAHGALYSVATFHYTVKGKAKTEKVELNT